MQGINFTRIIFRSIDKLLDLPQNPASLEKKLGDVRCEQDIVYSEKYPDMALDLYYLPRESGKYPVIFEIHGGGFSAGDKKYRRCLSRYYAKHTGAMVVTPNYGVGAENPCPLPMQQLVAAANWVADNADKYGMDLSRFVVTGDSAGAYYACFLAALQDSEYLQELYESKLKPTVTAAVLNCGVYNMRKKLADDNRLIVRGICRELTGMSLEDAVKSPYFKGLSLTSHVTEKFPETLLIYSENDIFCQGQGESLLRKLRRLRVPVRSICAKSPLDNHTYSLIWVTAKARQTNDKIIEFLNGHFAPSPAKDPEPPA